MQFYTNDCNANLYSLMKLEDVNDVVFVNGELPAYMRAFIDEKLGQ